MHCSVTGLKGCNISVQNVEYFISCLTEFVLISSIQLAFCTLVISGFLHLTSVLLMSGLQLLQYL